MIVRIGTDWSYVLPYLYDHAPGATTGQQCDHCKHYNKSRRFQPWEGFIHNIL